MKVLIIDDETKARSVLSMLISNSCPKVSEILQASDLLSGIEVIKKELPQIVFLDVEMPELTGLEIVNYIDVSLYNFEIIFVTAHDEYAVEAFKLSAIDYVLKPACPERIKAAVDKAILQLGKSQISLKLEELKQHLSSNSKRIGLPYAEGIKFIDFDKIIMIEANGMYTNVYEENSEAILVSKPLRFFIDRLENMIVFYRPHRSYIVNLKFIKEYIKRDGGYIVMENGKMISVPKEKRDEFLELIQSI